MAWWINCKGEIIYGILGIYFTRLLLRKTLRYTLRIALLSYNTKDFKKIIF
jgi:hypothetical protein